LLKLGLNGILLIFLVTVALIVSGCSGSNTGGTVTPTPQPGGGYMVGTPTAAPTAAPTPASSPVATEPSSVGQLYNIGDLHAYTYRMTSVVNGQTQTGTFTISFTDTTYNGVEARRIYLNFDVPATGGTGAGQMLVDVYTRKSDNSTLGGHMKWVANGQTIIDTDIPADEASSYSSKDLASSGRASDHTPLTKVGAETVTIDGKAYACTKYTYVEDGVTYTVWYTPQAPMPVEMKWTDDKGNPFLMELISWG
jgi:hypothetical protein